jgi:hypothetical protein
MSRYKKSEKPRIYEFVVLITKVIAHDGAINENAALINGKKQKCLSSCWHLIGSQ